VMLIEDSSLESNYGWSIPVDARVRLDIETFLR